MKSPAEAGRLNRTKKQKNVNRGKVSDGVTDRRNRDRVGGRVADRRTVGGPSEHDKYSTWRHGYRRHRRKTLHCPDLRQATDRWLRLTQAVFCVAREE